MNDPLVRTVEFLFITEGVRSVLLDIINTHELPDRMKVMGVGVDYPIRKQESVYKKL